MSENTHFENRKPRNDEIIIEKLNLLKIDNTRNLYRIYPIQLDIYVYV